MNVKERLKKFIKSIDMTTTAFEESLNVANGYINSISKSIGIDKVAIILEKYPNLNLEWLFTGRGEMEKKTIPITQNQSNEDLDKFELNESEYIISLKKQIGTQDELLNLYREKINFYEKRGTIESRLEEVEGSIEMFRLKFQIDLEIDKAKKQLSQTKSIEGKG
jgi:predicted ribosome quality control (RQC) complex YloA/Tae2 family protein